LNKQEIIFKESTKLGVSRMAADFVKNDPVKPSEIKAMTEFYKKKLEKIAAAVANYNPRVIVGSSGTMQNIASMIAASKGVSTSITLNEFEYSTDEFKRFYDLFITFNQKTRKKTTGLDTKRVDFIVPGMVLVNVVLNMFKIKRINTSVQAMREGIILEYIQKDLKALKMLVKYPETRERTIFELVKKYRWHEKHSTQVARLAVKLFDETQDIHELGNKERELLRYASLVHDIGYHISQRKHHKHSLYIILNSNLKGFTQEEIEIIAHVARYHRRSIPKAGSHELYSKLTEYQQETIRKLAGFLRVADGLDRSHYQNVHKLEVEKGKKLKIKLTTIADPELEIWGAMRKRELLEELLKMPVEVESVNFKNGTK